MVTIGTINGGQRFNIIANKVVMEGTVRTFSREDAGHHRGGSAPNRQEHREAFGATADVTKYNHMTPPLINDNEEINTIARAAAVKLFGEEGVGICPR